MSSGGLVDLWIELMISTYLASFRHRSSIAGLYRTISDFIVSVSRFC
jgi:hypothetical protein